MQRRLFLSTSVASSLSLAAPWVHAQGPLTPVTPLKFTLDFRVTSQTSPFFLALAKGYYKEEGLDVSIDGQHRRGACVLNASTQGHANA